MALLLISLIKKGQKTAFFSHQLTQKAKELSMTIFFFHKYQVKRKINSLNPELCLILDFMNYDNLLIT